ncbi:MAG: ROK family protein [Planctomycetota bacterium]
MLGIDVGGTSVKVALFVDGRWHVAASDPYAMPTRDELRQALRSAWERTGIDARPDGVGLCVPGIVAADGRSIERAINAPGLVGWDFDDLVHDAVGTAPTSVTCVSDATAALVDWQAESGEQGRSVGIAIGTGVGLCVMDGDRVAEWTGSGAGHLGQVDVTVGDPESAPVGPDGGRGGLEAYVGARAIEAAGGGARAFAPGAPGLIAMARAIRICHAIYWPDVVVLLGGVGIRLAEVDALETLVRRDLTSVALADWKLAFGRDGFYAARGAARLVGR